MSADSPFRIALLAIFLGFFPIAAYYRLQSRTREKLDRRQEGLFILLTLRPIGLANMLGLIVYLVNPARMAWSSVSLPDWLRWLGVGLGAAAGVLWIWTFRNLGKNLTDTVVTRREHTLVTTGPYRWIRHPFYAAIFLLFLANSLVTANWFLLLAGGVTFALLVYRTRKEEENLVARFGDSYRRYMERTGRFFPRMRQP